MNDTDAFNKIIAGVARFQSEIYPKERALFASLAEKQESKILFLTCADSRVNPNLITQTGPGDLFISRNIGNLIPPHGAADGGVATVMVYALDVLHIEHVIICGHSACGAMKSLLTTDDGLLIPQVTDWLRFAETARRVAIALHQANPELDLLKTAAQQNVIAQLTNIRTYPEVASKLAVGKLQLHGWYYDIGKGTVDNYRAETGTFAPLVENLTKATN